MKLIDVLFVVFWFICLISILAILVWLVILGIRAGMPNKPRRSDAEDVVEGWIARDKDGALWFYSRKPHRSGNMWNCDGPDFMRLNPRFLPSLRWEDEPIAVKLVKNK